VKATGPVKAVLAFQEAAGPVLGAMNANSCIAGTRIAIECLKLAGIGARPQAVKWAVEYPATKTAFAAGLTPEERATARESTRKDWGTPEEDAWNGHLVALTDKVLIDASFNQALETLELPYRKGMPMILPLPHECREEFGGAEYFMKKDDALYPGLRIRYLAIPDESWRDSIAWTDRDLMIAARVIYGRMNV
jgi:hypothetical protein